MLVTPATERVVDYVHCNPPYAGPVGRGIFHLVVLVAGFYERFVNTSPARNDTDCRPAPGIEPFCLAARHPDADAVQGLVNNNCLDAGCADELAAIVRS
jgi:hypothetical protein